MGLPRQSTWHVTLVLAFVAVAWILEWFGMVFLQHSCQSDLEGSEYHSWHYAVAQLPGSHSCRIIFRYQWLAVWLQAPLLLALAAMLSGYVGEPYRQLRRWRAGLIGLLAIVTGLNMWAANVALNLTDGWPHWHHADSPSPAPAPPPRSEEPYSEVVRARVAFVGFAAMAALNMVLILVLGEDREETFRAPGDELNEPLNIDA